MASPVKHWCFTLNDEAEVIAHETVMAFLSPHCDYVVFQQERGEEGTLHYQGYVELIKAQRLTQLVKLHPTLKPHWEKRKGTRQQARAYAMKDDTRVAGPWEGGQKPWSDKQGNAGQRTDLDSVARMVSEKKTDPQIFEEHPGATLKYLRQIQNLRQIWRPKRTVDLNVILCVGKPGTGKTSSFWEAYPEPEMAFSMPVGRNTWFTGYQGQPAVLVDDFSGGVGLTQALQIFDKYPIQLETKGGHVWWCPEVIVVTANVHPCNWYNYALRTDSFDALARRFSNVYHFTFIGGEYDVNEVDKHTYFYDMKEEGRYWPLWETNPTNAITTHVTGNE